MAPPPAESIFVATYTVTPDALARRGHQVTVDAPTGRILRSVIMKPESEAVIPHLHAGLERLVASGHPDPGRS